MESCQKYSVISSFIIPWILGLGCKTPTEAKKYIKNGNNFNNSYDKENIVGLFDENNIEPDLTEIVGENVYEPWNFFSGIYKIKINEKLRLIARPNGVTKNNECVVMIDDYLVKFNSDIEEEIKIKLLSTMAVWKAKKGVYIIVRIQKIIKINFDNHKWKYILNEIKLWSKTIQ